MNNDISMDEDWASVSLRQQGARDYRMSATVTLFNRLFK